MTDTAPDPQSYYESLRCEGLSPEEARLRVRLRFRAAHHTEAESVTRRSSWSTPEDDPSRLLAERRYAEHERNEVERDLAEAEALIEALEAEVAMLTRVAARRGLAVDENVESAPSRERLLVRGRTLLRRALHPDARPSEEVVRATREFQAVEALFDSLVEPA